MIFDKDLQIAFIVLYDNNPAGYHQAFKNAGYSVPTGRISAKHFIVKEMYRLYFNDPGTLRNIVNSVAWNPNAGNYTTDNGDLRDTILAYMKDNITLNGNAQRINWENLQGWLFGNQETVVTQTTTTPPSTFPAIIGYVFIGIAIVALAFISIRMLKA